MNVRIDQRTRKIKTRANKNIRGASKELKFAEIYNAQKNPMIKLTKPLKHNHAICPLVIESSRLDSSSALRFEYMGSFIHFFLCFIVLL
ncbi:hypothetical protein [Helicobacter trogontum]|uniref:hypothetical protein n=1 Tax=Helicobacter trogontum TaxID=50960 RepID=UPI0018F80321|nr:hypothetical protein [Helicobacter trogontum]